MPNVGDHLTMLDLKEIVEVPVTPYRVSVRYHPTNKTFVFLWGLEPPALRDL